MALSAGFRNRITLEGEQEVTRGFAAVGRAGEQAFGDVKKAVNDSSRGFLTFRGNLNDLSTSFQGVARTSIGFKTALAGLVTGGVVAGITEFVKAAATAADDVGDSAAALGLSAERFQEFKLAARTAGLDIEKFSAAFSKLSANVDTESKKQIDALGSIGKAFSGDQIINQTANVLRGMQDVKAASVEAGVSVRRGADETQRGFVKINDAARDKLGGVAELLRGAFKQAGITTLFPNLEKQLAQASQGTSDAAVKIRKNLSDLGVELPAETVGEALDKLSETAEQKLGSFVQLWERTDQGLRKRKLEDVFLDFADAMQAIDDPAQRASAVIGVFGARIGARLVPLLKDGRKGILDIGEAFTKAGLNFTTADTEIGGKFADQLDILSTALTNARNIFALPIAAAFQPVLEAATDAIRDNAGTIRAWAAEVAGRLQPAIADFVSLIQQGNKAELKTEFAKDLVGTFQKLRDFGSSVADSLKLVGAAFRGVGSAVDVVLAPINALFGTKFRGDVLLGVAALVKIVGGFAAIEAAIALAKVGLIAFTAIARLSPFGLLAAAVALFVAKLTEGSDVAKRFWDSVSGTSDEAAKTLSDTAASAASFGTAASEAEKAVAGALGTTQRLGDAAQTTGARFVSMADAVPKAADGLPTVLRGVQQVGGAAEEVRGKFVNVTAQTAAFRKEVEAAAKAATATAAAPSVVDNVAKQVTAEIPGAGALAENDNAFIPPARTITAWEAFQRDFGGIAQGIIEDFHRIRDEAKRAPQEIADDVEGARVPLPRFLQDWRKAFDDFFASIGKNAVDQAQLDSLFPQTLPVTKGWTTQLANWAKDAAGRVGEVFTTLPAAGDPSFLGSWGLAVDKFATDSSGKIRDQFAQLDVPAQPGFLTSWGSAITTWLSGQVSEIRAAFSSVSLPSLVSSAQAAPVTAGAGGAGAGAVTAGTGAVGVVDSATQAIDRARSQLNDLVASVSTAISDAVNRITDLITNSGQQLQDFFDGQKQALSDLVQTTLDSLSTVVDNAITVITGGIQTAFDTLQSSATTVFGFISSQIDTINGLLSTLADTVSAIGSAIGSAVGSVAGAIPGFAGGGHIRGPGTSTSDSVLIAASAGEHITRAKAVSYYGPGFFDLLNRMTIPRDALRQLLAGLKGFNMGGLVGGMSQPVVNFSIPRFAQGGLVTAPAAVAGGGTTVPIVLDGHTFNFLADEDVAESFLRTARRKQMTSGGRRVGIR